MNWNGCVKKLPWPNLRCHPGIYLEELMATTETLVRILNDPAKILIGF
jgi:hypothetical protein